jgi:hypothetical protein
MAEIVLGAIKLLSRFGADPDLAPILLRISSFGFRILGLRNWSPWQDVPMLAVNTVNIDAANFRRHLKS